MVLVSTSSAVAQINYGGDKNFKQVNQEEYRNNNYMFGEGGGRRPDVFYGGDGNFKQINRNEYGSGAITGGQSPETKRLQELNKPNLTVVGVTNWFIQILNYIAILLFAAALS